MIWKKIFDQSFTRGVRDVFLEYSKKAYNSRFSFSVWRALTLVGAKLDNIGLDFSYFACDIFIFCSVPFFPCKMRRHWLEQIWWIVTISVSILHAGDLFFRRSGNGIHRQWLLHLPKKQRQFQTFHSQQLPSATISKLGNNCHWTISRISV